MLITWIFQQFAKVVTQLKTHSIFGVSLWMIIIGTMMFSLFFTFILRQSNTITWRDKGFKSNKGADSIKRRR